MNGPPARFQGIRNAGLVGDGREVAGAPRRCPWWCRCRCRSPCRSAAWRSRRGRRWPCRTCRRSRTPWSSSSSGGDGVADGLGAQQVDRSHVDRGGADAGVDRHVQQLLDDDAVPVEVAALEQLRGLHAGAVVSSSTPSRFVAGRGRRRGGRRHDVVPLAVARVRTGRIFGEARSPSASSGRHGLRVRTSLVASTFSSEEAWSPATVLALAAPKSTRSVLLVSQVFFWPAVAEA
jgi:hypothetical protein